jgi:hypothetical protein
MPLSVVKATKLGELLASGWPCLVCAAVVFGTACHEFSTHTHNHEGCLRIFSHRYGDDIPLQTWNA